jgi:sulfur carrier protein
MALTLILNGQSRVFETLPQPVSLEQLIGELGLKGDRVAVEHNGEIVPRTGWAETLLNGGDRLELVHFVGGGCGEPVTNFFPMT